MQANGAVAAGISVHGIIVRDLQLPEQARHAYVLRPLPARARRLNAFLNLLRRQLLGVVRVSPAKYRRALPAQLASCKHWLPAAVAAVAGAAPVLGGQF